MHISTNQSEQVSVKQEARRISREDLEQIVISRPIVAYGVEHETRHTLRNNFKVQSNNNVSRNVTKLSL